VAESSLAHMVSYAIDCLYQKRREKGRGKERTTATSHGQGRNTVAKWAVSDTVTGMETRTPQKLYAYVDESGQEADPAMFEAE
jgi:hypothetical protein